jgi:hypothetical protein
MAVVPAKWLRLPWNICEVHSANDILGRDTPISRIEFRLQELKSSEPPAHTRRFRGTIDKTRRSRSFGSPAQRQPRMANRHTAQPRPTAKGASQ